MAKKARTRSRSSHPYVLHVKYAPARRFTTVGGATGAVKKMLADRRDWAQRFAKDALPDLAAAEDGVSAIKHLDVGKSFSDELCVDPHSKTRLSYVIFHDDGIKPQGAIGL